MPTLRSAVIRLAHTNPGLRSALLSTLRSASSNHVNDYFDIYKAKDGQWYGQAMAYDIPYDADEDDDDADYGYVEDGPTYGPFPDENTASNYLHDQHANRGDQVDDSGHRPIPRHVDSPRRSRW
jgi:hypothetical protein